MQYEGTSVYFLAEIRHAELQAEIEQYRSGRQEPSLIPGFSTLTLAGWGRVIAVANAIGTMAKLAAPSLRRPVPISLSASAPARGSGVRLPAEPLA